MLGRVSKTAGAWGSCPGCAWLMLFDSEGTVSHDSLLDRPETLSKLAPDLARAAAAGANSACINSLAIAGDGSTTLSASGAREDDLGSVRFAALIDVVDGRRLALAAAGVPAPALSPSVIDLLKTRPGPLVDEASEATEVPLAALLLALLACAAGLVALLPTPSPSSCSRMRLAAGALDVLAMREDAAAAAIGIDDERFMFVAVRDEVSGAEESV